jgi:hypothetical protein
MPSFNPEPAPPGFEIHDRVRHKEFGRGYVAKVLRDRYLIFFLQDGKSRELKENTLERCG